MRVFAGKRLHCRDKAATASRFIYPGELSPLLSTDPWTEFVVHNGFWSCVQQKPLQPSLQLRRSFARSLYSAGLAWRCSAFEKCVQRVPAGELMPDVRNAFAGFERSP